MGLCLLLSVWLLETDREEALLTDRNDIQAQGMQPLLAVREVLAERHVLS
jgi:hypothetical protein